MQKITSLCRPIIDSGIYCFECCLGCNCFLLGPTGDGMWGCRGWQGKYFQGLTQTPFCREMTCWDPDYLRDPEIQQVLTEFFVDKQGRYSAEEIFDRFKLRREIKKGKFCSKLPKGNPQNFPPKLSHKNSLRADFRPAASQPVMPVHA